MESENRGGDVRFRETEVGCSVACRSPREDGKVTKYLLAFEHMVELKKTINTAFCPEPRTRTEVQKHSIR